MQQKVAIRFSPLNKNDFNESFNKIEIKHWKKKLKFLFYEKFYKYFNGFKIRF